MQTVDNLNIFYVALTRAGKSLHIIAGNPSDKLRGALAKNKEPEYKDMSQLLYAYAGQLSECRYGEPYDFHRMKRKEESTAEEFQSGYPSFPLGERLEPSSDAQNIFIFLAANSIALRIRQAVRYSTKFLPVSCLNFLLK